MEAVHNDEWVGHGHGHHRHGWRRRPASRSGHASGAASRQAALGDARDAPHVESACSPASDRSTRRCLGRADQARVRPRRVAARRLGKAVAVPEAKLVIDTWVAHADPNRIERSGADSFESRRLHLSKILDGVGVIDGQLDAEGTEIVRQALALLSKRVDKDTRTRPAQR